MATPSPVLPRIEMSDDLIFHAFAANDDHPFYANLDNSVQADGMLEILRASDNVNIARFDPFTGDSNKMDNLVSNILENRGIYPDILNLPAFKVTLQTGKHDHKGLPDYYRLPLGRVYDYLNSGTFNHSMEDFKWMVAIAGYAHLSHEALQTPNDLSDDGVYVLRLIVDLYKILTKPAHASFLRELLVSPMCYAPFITRINQNAQQLRDTLSNFSLIDDNTTVATYNAMIKSLFRAACIHWTELVCHMTVLYAAVELDGGNFSLMASSTPPRAPTSAPPLQPFTNTPAFPQPGERSFVSGFRPLSAQLLADPQNAQIVHLRKTLQNVSLDVLDHPVVLRNHYGLVEQRLTTFGALIPGADQGSYMTRDGLDDLVYNKLRESYQCFPQVQQCLDQVRRNHRTWERTKEQMIAECSNHNAKAAYLAAELESISQWTYQPGDVQRLLNMGDRAYLCLDRDNPAEFNQFLITVFDKLPPYLGQQIILKISDEMPFDKNRDDFNRLISWQSLRDKIEYHCFCLKRWENLQSRVLSPGISTKHGQITQQGGTYHAPPNAGPFTAQPAGQFNAQSTAQFNAQSAGQVNVQAHAAHPSPTPTATPHASSDHQKSKGKGKGQWKNKGKGKGKGGHDNWDKEKAKEDWKNPERKDHANHVSEWKKDQGDWKSKSNPESESKKDVWKEQANHASNKKAWELSSKPWESTTHPKRLEGSKNADSKSAWSDQPGDYKKKLKPVPTRTTPKSTDYENKKDTTSEFDASQLNIDRISFQAQLYAKRWLNYKRWLRVNVKTPGMTHAEAVEALYNFHLDYDRMGACNITGEKYYLFGYSNQKAHNVDMWLARLKDHPDFVGFEIELCAKDETEESLFYSDMTF